MRLSQIFFAVTAIAAAAGAIAATPVGNIAIVSGASASKGNFKLALANRCSGQLGEYANGTNTSTYVCAPAGSFANADAPTAAEYNAAGSVNFTGTAIGEVRLNVNGGSFSAVCLLAGWPAGTKCAAPETYVDPAIAPSLAAAPGGALVAGGLMDVEPNGFLSTIRVGIANPPVVESANFGQTFGVAVSNDLYTAMFNDQKAAGTLPATCNLTDTAVATCVPVIGRGQMATIMSANDTNAAYTNGANFLAPSLAAGTQLKYARRVDTSGTQASAQQYFMGSVCNSGARPVVVEGPAAGAVVGTAMLVYGLSSTGNVRTVLNASGYAIGVMSGENNQVSQSWKWLRIDGSPIGQSAQPAQFAGITNTATTFEGRYDFWYLSRVVRPANATAQAFWNSVRTGFGAVPVNSTVGLFRTNETTYSRGTATSCAPVFSL